MGEEGCEVWYRRGREGSHMGLGEISRGSEISIVLTISLSLSLSNFPTLITIFTL